MFAEPGDQFLTCFLEGMGSRGGSLACPRWPPALLDEAGLGGERLRDGGSEEGGLDELVEFCLSWAWRSARRRS